MVRQRSRAQSRQRRSKGSRCTRRKDSCRQQPCRRPERYKLHYKRRVRCKLRPTGVLSYPEPRFQLPLPLIRPSPVQWIPFPRVSLKLRRPERAKR